MAPGLSTSSLSSSYQYEMWRIQTRLNWDSIPFRFVLEPGSRTWSEVGGPWYCKQTILPRDRGQSHWASRSVPESWEGIPVRNPEGEKDWNMFNPKYEMTKSHDLNPICVWPCSTLATFSAFSGPHTHLHSKCNDERFSLPWGGWWMIVGKARQCSNSTSPSFQLWRDHLNPRSFTF